MMRGTSRSKTVALGYVNARSHLCIMVLAADNENAMPIPETMPYVAMKSFASASGRSAAFPPGTVSHPLGRIMRDGTTVRIPYLTKFAEYNQRIVVVNRGPNDVNYDIEFVTENGVTATPGPYASGMLPAGQTTYLSLMHKDVVTLEGPFQRVSATVIIESQLQYIDVLVSQTNSQGSGTDTVRYPDDSERFPN